MSTSELDLIVAGTVDGVLMVESEAKELSEEVMLGAVMFGHREFQPVIQAIIEMAERCAKEPWPMPEASALMGEVKAKIQATVGADLRQAYTETVKQTRYEAARFAAKEAVAKALGTGIGVVTWTEIEIIRGSQRLPELRLPGTAARLAAELGLSEWAVSLSHTHQHAVAFAVAATAAPGADD